MADLQDRRLVRMWEFGEGKDGWRGLMRFAQTVGQIVEEEDVSGLKSTWLHFLQGGIGLGLTGIASSYNHHLPRVRLQTNLHVPVNTR